MIPKRNLPRLIYKALRQPEYAMRVFLKRLVAFAYYKLGNGRAANPEAITLFLTHRCNLHCKMCGQWGESGVTRSILGGRVKQELNFEELKKIIDQAGCFKPNITLFGGEPLIHPNAIELIRYIKSKGMHCLIVTNGSLLFKQAGSLVEAGLDELNLSLDGGEKLHDEIRGMPGLFSTIKQGLLEVKKQKEVKNLKKPLINLQCTVTKYNYERLEEVLETAKEIGVDSLTYHNLIFLDREILNEQKKIDRMLNCSSDSWAGFVYDPGIDPEILHRKMTKILQAETGFGIDFYPNFSKLELLEYYKNPAYKPKEYAPRCLSPWIVSYIFPDGEMRPCLNTTYSFGSVVKDDLLRVWNSDSAVRFRRELKNNKIFPACVRCTELYRY